MIAVAFVAATNLAISSFAGGSAAEPWAAAGAVATIVRPAAAANRRALNERRRLTSMKRSCERWGKGIAPTWRTGNMIDDAADVSQRIRFVVRDAAEAARTSGPRTR